MKVTVFNGSPAGENSATNVIASSFLKGASQAGAETKNIYLKEHHITQCQGCFSCWFTTPGKCRLSDDMEQLLKEYQESSIICFATPVYTWNMTALLKNFVDRLAPLKCPQMIEKQGHFDLKDEQEKAQKFVVLSNCGFPGENNFDVMKAVFSCCNPSLEIYRNCGKLLKMKSPVVEKKVNTWLQSVEQAGKEMVLQGDITNDTKIALAMPLMSVEEYVSLIGM